MAKPPKRPGANDFDSGIDFAADEFTFEDPIGNSREPAKPVRDGVKQAFKSHLTSEDNLRRYVQKALPPQYEDMFGTAVKAKNAVEEAFDEVTSATKKPINDLSKLLGNRIPKRYGRTHKLIDWIRDRTDEYEFDKKSQSRIDSDETQAALSGMDKKLEELLAASAAAAEDGREREEDRDNTKRAEDYLLFTNQNKILQAVQRDIQIMQGYTTTVDFENKRKMLESTYRMAFGIRDLNSKLNELTELSRAHLKAIAHNTGLPEEQKLTLYERGKGNLKNKFINKTIGRFTDGSNNFMDNFIDRVKANVISTGKDAAEMIRQGTFMTDMVTEHQDDFSGLTQDEQARKRYAQMLASLGLDAIGPSALGGAAQKLRKNSPKLEKLLQRVGSKGGYMVGNAHSLAKNFAYNESPDDGFFKKMARAMVGMGLPGTDQDSGLDVASGNRLTDATHTDMQMRRAQIEVVPSLLSMMVRELRFMRTGQDPGLLHFDYKRGGFKTTMQAKSDILGSLKRNAFMKTNMDTLTKDVTEGMSEDDKLALQKHLLYKKRSGATMTERSLMNENFFDHTDDAQKRKDIAARFAKFMDSEGGKFSDSDKANERREWFFSNLKTASDYGSDNRAAIQQAANEGHLPLLREMGLIDENNNMSRDAMYLWDLMQDPDINEKKEQRLTGQARGMNPRLESLMAAQQQQLAGGAQQQQQQQIQQRPRAPVQNLSFKGYERRGVPSTMFAPPTSKHIDTNANGDLCVCKDKFDVLGDILKQMNEGHGLTLQEIRDNTSKLGIYFVQGAQLSAAQAGDNEGVGFWDKTLGEHAKAMGARSRSLMGKIGRGAKGAVKATKRFVDGDNAFTSWARSMKGMGARYLDEMVDGLPRWGDIYVKGQQGVAITKAMLKGEMLRDAKGNVIKSLKDVAGAIGDIYDEAGNVVLSESDRLKSYLRGDALQFAKKWAETLTKKGREFAGKAWEVGKDMFGMGQRTAARVRKFAMGAAVFAAEVIAPTKDVYVRGETNERGERMPKLYASLIRKGWYIDVKSGKTIYSEAQITGPLMDPDGNIALTSEDITKGLEDVDGNPIRTLREMAADFVRTNVKRGLQRTRQAVVNTKKVMMAVGRKVTSAAFGAGRSISRFLKFGMSGFGGGSAAQQAGQEASEDQNMANGMTVALLTQIRDVLFHGFGDPYSQGGIAAGVQKATGTLSSKIQTWKAGLAAKAGGASAAGASAGPSVNTTAGQAAGNSANYTQTSQMKSPGDFLSGLGGSAIAGATKLGKGLLDRFRKRRGRGVPGGGSDGDGVSREDLKQAIDESRKEGEKLTIKEKLKDTKDRFMDGVKAMRQRKEKQESGGEEPKENSVAALRKKFTNSFQNFRDQREHNFSDFGVRNSIDVLTDTAKAAKDKVAGFFSNAEDMLPDGDERRGRGKGRGGRAAKRAARKKAAQAASKAAAKKAATTVAQKAAGSAGAAGAGALARRGAFKAMAGWGLKRAALAAGGGILSVLGAPAVATALGVAGAVWTAKSIYDWFMSNPRDIDKPKPGSANEILKSIRMVEYGVGLDSPQLMARLGQFEAMVAPAIKGDPGSLTIDPGKIDADQALALFGISKDSGDAVDSFLVWLERRFKPTFLKWMDYAQVAKLKIGELDKLEDEKRLKILDETERTPTGWDVLESPFNGGTLQIDEDAVKANISNARDLLQRNMKKRDAGDNPKDPFNVEKKNLTSIQPAIQKMVDKRAEDYQSKLMGLRETGSAAMATKEAQSSSSFSSFQSAKHARAAYGTVDELTSIRMRAYGFSMLTPASLASIEALEKFAYKSMTFDNSGLGNFNGDMYLVLQEAARVFGFSLKDEVQRSNAETWLNKRFMPVFVEFAAAMRVNIGKMDLHEGLQTLTPPARVTVATAILSHDEIWNVSVLPVYGVQATMEASAVKPFMERLEAMAREKTMTELNKAPPQRFGEDVNNAAQTMRNQPETSKNDTSTPSVGSAKAPTPSAVQKVFAGADAETEPKGLSSSGGEKPSAPSAGLTIAEGKLYSGNNADQYLDLRKGAKLQGLHPEVEKMLRGMAEEFGTHTGLKIGVNSGFRSYEDQVQAAKNNPGKAAKPGSSLHESGLAIDIDSATADKLEKLGLMRKYGFTRPVGGEPWHIEPAGIQGAISQAKANPDSFTSAIAGSAGKGGGGVGMTRTGFPMGKRDSEAALRYQTAGAQTVKNDQERKLPPGAVPLPTSGQGDNPSSSKSSGGGYGGSIMNAGNNEAGKGAYASLPTGGGVEGAKKLVQEGAKIVGIDPQSAMIKVGMESGFKSGAKADGSSGQGLWQMTKGAWSDSMRKHGEKYGIPPNATPLDDRANALLGAEYVKDNLQIAEKKGLPTDIMSAYAMHFFGPGGGPKYLALPDGAVVAEAMPDAARVPGNKNVFYDKSGRARTKGEMDAYFRERMNTAARSIGIEPPAGGSVTAPSSSPASAPVNSTDPRDRKPAPAAAPSGQAASLAGPFTPPQPMRAVAEQPAALNQDTGLQALSKEIGASKDVQVEQLTVLQGIFDVLNEMKTFMTDNKKQASTPAAPSPVAPPAPEPSPGSQRRTVSPPLI